MVTMSFDKTAWAWKNWNPNQCDILPLVDGRHVIVDTSHNMMVIAQGNTREECYQWLMAKRSQINN